MVTGAKWLVLFMALAFVSALVGAKVSSAAPYLVTDATPSVDGVTYFEVEINGKVVSGQAVAGGFVLDKALSFDAGAANLADGSIDFRTRPCNVWGCGDWSTTPLSVVKKVPDAAQGLRLQASP